MLNRNNNDFDEVSEYKKSNESSKEDKTRSNVKHEENNFREFTRIFSKTKYTIVSIFILFGIVGGMYRMFTSKDDANKEIEAKDKKDAPTLKQYKKYSYNNEKLTKAEFKEEYENAKKNRVVFDKKDEIYKSGNYKENHVIDQMYVNIENEIKLKNGDTVNYVCAYNKPDFFNESQAEKNKRSILVCGLMYDYDYVNLPTDLKMDFETYYKYLKAPNKSNNLYYINGTYYSTSLANKIIK
ncbi:MAG: hypothetical protein RR543_00040 [Erysipelotrichales bacterium]